MRPTTSILFLLMIASLPQVARAADNFDGKWKVTILPSDENPGPREDEYEDLLTFGGSKFFSKKFLALGFKPVVFESDTRRGPLGTFIAKPESEKNGTMEWRGTTTGVDISGEMTWTKADGTVLRYTYKGERQPEK